MHDLHGGGYDVTMRWVILALAGCAADTPPWPVYTIPAGAHDATLAGRLPHDPIDGITQVTGRDYEIELDASAAYDLGTDDQADWNKLPGLSDCGKIDLSEDGVMIGWRWRTDLGAVELAAYANDDGMHLAQPLLTSAPATFHVRLWREPDHYRIDVDGHTATLPRACPEDPLDDIAWAAGFYFGGTSVAPHAITARIHEIAFR